MPGTFTGINIASNALRAFQYGMDITGHNMANVNTQGYSRQSVEFGAVQPITFWSGTQFQMGQGTSITSINRLRDQFVEARMNGAQAEFGRYDALSNTIQQIETIFNEPGGTGISTALDRFFNSWSSLSSHPAEAASRLEVQQAGQNLADRIRGTFSTLRQFATENSTLIQQTFGDIDNLSSTIAQLNGEIREQMASGGAPNDLMDQRDRAVEQLSQMVNVTVLPMENGAVSVHFGGYPIVDQAGSHAMPSTFDASSFQLSNGTYSFPVRSGKLFGLFELSNKIEEYKASLDTLANSLRSEVNSLHKTGTAPNGISGLAFFVENAIDPQNGAIDFDLTFQIKSDVDNIASSTSGVIGDGGLALSLSNVRNNSTALGNKSYTRWFTEFIGGVGRDAQNVSYGLETQEAVRQQVEMQRQSISGVSIDDEMAQMLRLQKSYQAVAKILSMFDQMTEDLLGMVR